MDIPTGAVLLDQLPATVVNTTDIPNRDIFAAVEQQDRGLFAALSEWVGATRPLTAFAEGAGATTSGPLSGGGRAGGLFSRDRYITPSRPFDQMRLAYAALSEDDIVSGVADTTESLAFSAVSFFSEDPDEQDVYNQIAARIDLDARLREIWREVFAVSQAYVAVDWGRQTFRVRGRTTSGQQRRRTMELFAPKSLTLLDPLKIVPVGSPYTSAFFGNDRLAYIATRDEATAIDRLLDPPVGAPIPDAVVARIIERRWEPENRAELTELQGLGVDTTNLYLIKQNAVFRHTLTRPGYRRIPDVRMKSIFELLDTKHQLRQMERAHLIGGTNFIVLVTKGTDQHPALPAEVANLQAQVRTVARVPILVGDHRLNVEIITPRLDNTLKPERWNTLDSRITGRLYQMFVLGNYSAGASGDDSVKLVKVIARGMESRRHMIRRSLERHVFRPLFDGNEALTSYPKLQFHPRSIALDFDSAYASFLFDLRQSKELSRETILNQFDLDQDLEAEYREREAEQYDEVFQTQVPFSTPANGTPDPQPALPRDNGGGNRNGGGAAPGTGQGQPPRRVGRQQRQAAALEQLKSAVQGADDPRALLQAALDSLEEPRDD